MKTTLVIGLVVGSALLGACAHEEHFSVSCDLAATITFQGREYAAADTAYGVRRRDAQRGERLGLGDVPTCPGQDQQHVRVFAVVGVPVGRAVIAEPRYGLMKRFDRAGSIK